MQIRWMLLEGQSGHEAGRQLLEQMYRDLTGKPVPPILTTPRGKPYFAEGDLHFSISHTKKRVFCALSHRPVGIDGEEQDRQIDLRLAEKILSPREREHYEKAADQRTALLRLWVLKEAAAKCSGEGLRGYPNHTEFDPADSRIREIEGCFVAVIEEGENGYVV